MRMFFTFLSFQTNSSTGDSLATLVVSLKSILEKKTNLKECYKCFHHIGPARKRKFIHRIQEAHCVVLSVN